MAHQQLDPNEAGSLERTLEGTSPGAQASATPKAISLDDSEDSGFAFRSLMRQMGQMAVQQQPSPMEKLRSFKEVTGLEAQTAGAIGGVLEAGEKERLMGITEHFRTAMDLMKEQEERKEKQRQENTRWGEMLFKSIDNPLSVFSGEDIENMKLGIVTPEMNQKLITAQSKKTDKDKKQYIPANEYQPARIFNTTTGEVSDVEEKDLPRPTRNNNPLNVKLGGQTQKWLQAGATLDTSPATDGGQFLKFQTPEQGFQAAQELLFNSGIYSNLSVDEALKKWSNKGYGGEIAPSIKDKKISELNPNIQNELIQTMALREGYQPRVEQPDLVDENLKAYAEERVATGKIPTGMPKGKFGEVSRLAKELPKPKGTIVNVFTGIKDAGLSATVESDFARLYNITENVKRLKELDEKRIGGLIAGGLGKVFGSQAQADYLAVRKSIVDDIQRMQSGAALTETETKFYADYLPGRLSESFFLGQDSLKKIENFQKIMNNRLKERLAMNSLSVYGYSTIKLDGKEYTVGDVIQSSDGKQGRVNPDGSITILR